jgi:hypothetical protein
MNMPTILALTLAGVLTFTIPAEAAKAGAGVMTTEQRYACMEACRARLTAAGTFSQYPRGYCRVQQCGLPPVR